MGRTRELTVLAACLLAASCGSGGGGTGGSNGQGSRSTTGDLALLEHAPAADAVQVAIDASVWLRFDGIVVNDCLADENLRIETTDGERVPVAFAIEGNGREVRLTPSQALRPETDYLVHLSPFVCDASGRILGEQVSFEFRTVDSRPPQLVSASVANNATGVDRLADLMLVFDEALAPASVDGTTVYLADVWGGRYPCALAVVDRTRVRVDPLADLAGDRRYLLVVQGGNRGVTDRAGNVLAQAWNTSFTTAPDPTSPHLAETWPPAQQVVSPHVRPELTFDESIDPASVEPNSITLVDEFANVHRLQLQPDDTRRRLRLAPLAPLPKGSNVRLNVAGGLGALTDLSGNTLANGTSVSWTVGSDDEPPHLVASSPEAGAERVSLNVIPRVELDEELDALSVHSDTVTLRDDGGTVPTTLTLLAGGRTVELAPASLLRAGTRYVLRLRGGTDGLRDRAGNVLESDVEIEFRVADDATVPQVIMLPPEGSAAVPVGSRVSAVFDSVLDPASVTDDCLVVTTRTGQPVGGAVVLSRGGRALRFDPLTPWTPGTWYRVTLRGGEAGVREASGNRLASDLVHEFRAGFTTDVRAPVVRVSVNAAADSRKQDMQVPAAGFTVDVFGSDPGDYAFDPASFEVTIVGPGGPPGSDGIFAEATITRDQLSWRARVDAPFAPGDYQLLARARDLSGNLGEADVVRFTVIDPAAEKVPFERTHVVWARTDLDRDGNGRGDFLDDLIKLGFATDGDPAGLNARMESLLRDGVLATAHELFERRANGGSAGDGSVAIRFTHRRPLGLAHMQIAVGGLDPEGPRLRDYGDESTGVLGRAYYDHYNRQTNDLNIGTNPGLGVFPGELFLFQALIHRRVYPAFVTSFARRFLNLAPAMGGTPVGAGRDDATVLAPGFDYLTATGEQRVRYDNVFRAADEWATAIGIILAHEVGHAVGLVAEGPSPTGLHGDASLHDEGAGVADVMSPAVGYDSLIQLDYAFRDLDLAYLRHRLILK